MTATVDRTQVPTLVVAEWESRCSACGRPSALAPAHYVGGGWDGCDVDYEAVAVAADGRLELDDTISALARLLELPYAGRQPMPRRPPPDHRERTP